MNQIIVTTESGPPLHFHEEALKIIVEGLFVASVGWKFYQAIKKMDIRSRVPKKGKKHA